MQQHKTNKCGRTHARAGCDGAGRMTDVLAVWFLSCLSAVVIHTTLSQNPIVVLGPGTGLGEALAFCDPNGDLQVFPTEGGHCGFCPWDDVTRNMQLFFEHVYGFAEQETVRTDGLGWDVDVGVHGCV